MVEFAKSKETFSQFVAKQVNVLKLDVPRASGKGWKRANSEIDTQDLGDSWTEEVAKGATHILQESWAKANDPHCARALVVRAPRIAYMRVRVSSLCLRVSQGCESVAHRAPLRDRQRALRGRIRQPCSACEKSRYVDSKLLQTNGEVGILEVRLLHKEALAQLEFRSSQTRATWACCRGAGSNEAIFRYGGTDVHPRINCLVAASS